MEDLVFTRKSSGLVKGLRRSDVFLSVIAAPAGSGILYYSVSTASTYPGASISLSFLIGLLLVLPIVFLAATSSAIIPRSGSLYVLISRIVSPGLAFLAACLFFLGYTLSIGVLAYIIVQVVGGILVSASLAGDAPAMEQLGTALQQPTWSALGGTILVVLTWLIVLRGVRLFRNVMRVLFAITALSAAVAISCFVFIGHDHIVSLFNANWGPDAYAQVLLLAGDHGWTAPHFSMSTTMGLLLVVLFSYGGVELISHASGEVSGEVRGAERRVIRTYIGAALVLGLIYIAIAFAVQRAFGEFIGAYDYLQKNHPDALAEVMPAISPSIPFYICSIMPNPWLSIAISLGIALWLATTMIPYFFAPSRLIFALAMDRSIPGPLADVSARTGAATKASHLTLCFALLGVFFNFLNVGTVLGTILFSAIFVYWLYGLAAFLLPYKNPRLFSKVPLQSRFFGVPTFSLLGLLTFCIGWLAIFIALRNMSLGVGLVVCGYICVCMLSYWFMLRRNKLRGIDPYLIYSAVPPGATHDD